MTTKVRPELRASILLLCVVAIYFASVFGFVARHKGQFLTDFPPNGIINQGLLAVWGATIGVVSIVYLARLVSMRHPSGVMRRLAEDFKAFCRPEILAVRATIFISWFFLMWAFTIFKVMIGTVHTFTLDHGIAAFEHALLFGRDAWQYTHYLFGSAPATLLLQVSYNAWFALMWASIIFCLLFPDNVRAILHYLLAFVLCWIIVGSLAAYFLASAGPCFYERVFGDPHFRPLMSRLYGVDHTLSSVLPALQLTSLDVQDLLWDWHAGHHDNLGAGISAMPSVHVGLAYIMARGSFLIRPVYGRLMSLYVAVVWIASVHLGWHYALDGAVALVLAMAIWKVSDWLTEVCLNLQSRKMKPGILAPALAFKAAAPAAPSFRD